MKRLGLFILLGLVGLLPVGCAKTSSPDNPTSPSVSIRFFSFGHYGIGTDGTFNGGPSGIALSGNFIYVADDDFSAVDKFDLQGNFLGQNNYGFDTDLGGMAVDRSGNVYVANYYYGTVDELDSNLNYLKSFTGSGTFDGPFDVKVDINSNLFVTDYSNDAVYKVSQADVVLATSSGIPGGLYYPYQTAMTPDGHFYVADYDDSRVVGLDNNLAYTNQFDGSSGTAFSGPTGIASDRDGNLIVADYNNANVQKFTPSGTFIQSFGNTSVSNTFSSPYFVAVDSFNRIYVTDYDNENVSVFIQ